MQVTTLMPYQISSNFAVVTEDKIKIFQIVVMVKISKLFGTAFIAESCLAAAIAIVALSAFAEMSLSVVVDNAVVALIVAISKRRPSSGTRALILKVYILCNLIAVEKPDQDDTN